MKAWSDPTEPKIMLPRGYKYPFSALPPTITKTPPIHWKRTGNEYQGSLGPWTSASRVSQPVPGIQDVRHTSEIITASGEMRVIINVQVYCSLKSVNWSV